MSRQRFSIPGTAPLLVLSGRADSVSRFNSCSDRDAHGLLAGFASQGSGQYERAIEEASIALAIDPDFSPGYVNIAYSNFVLNRMAEVQKTIRTAA
jgi:hypothetical protein